MGELRVVLAAAGVSVVVACSAVAVASGPPPPEPGPAPDVRTVVGHGTAWVEVAKPQRRADASIEKVVRAARLAALPDAVDAARADAIRVARAAGLTLGKPIGVERQVSPYGYGGDEEGVRGPGQWCWTWRGKHRCHVPQTLAVRITLTVAAS